MGADRGEIELMLCGDVMLGRGIDQILPYPGDPALFEPHVRSARGYVDLAERIHGAIPAPVSFDYVWGDALELLAARRREACPHLLVVNLETAVTRRGEPVPKGINYRMTPENLPVLEAAGVDCCVLANNHVLDWGRAGLEDTLASLGRAGMATAGAGIRAAEAGIPATLPLDGSRRVLLWAFASPSSGVPSRWAAGDEYPGVNLIADLDEATAACIAAQVRGVKRPGDFAVVSIHWGGNWGYEIAADQHWFAHRLIEAGVDVVHGHSSHHPRAIELYAGRPILYGCGDFLNDYEGIRGHESYRGDLVLLYLVRLASDGRLARFDMLPFRIRRFRLERAVGEDLDWLHRGMDRECRRFGNRVLHEGDRLRLSPASTSGLRPEGKA